MWVDSNQEVLNQAVQSGIKKWKLHLHVIYELLLKHHTFSSQIMEM